MKVFDGQTKASRGARHPAKGQMPRRPAEPQPLQAPQAIDGELRILVGLLKQVTGPEKLVLGGGGLLEAMWSHRRSTDIDLFVEQREEVNVARDMMPTREEMKKALTRLNRVGEAYAEGAEARGALLRGDIHGVPYTVYPNPMLMERRIRRRTIPGVRARWATVSEVLAGKMGDRWVKDLAEAPRGVNGRPIWTPPVRDLYDIAVARARAPADLDVALGKVPNERREAIAEALGQVTNEELEKDAKRLINAKYSADLVQVANEVGEAIRTGSGKGITPARSLLSQQREQGVER